MTTLCAQKGTPKIFIIPVLLSTAETKSGASQLSVTSQAQTCRLGSTRVAVPRLRRSVAGLSPRRHGFDPGSVHVGFVVDKVALGQVFSPITSVFPCQFHSTGPPLHGNTGEKTNHLHHRVAQDCGASVASAAGPLATKKNTVFNKVISLNVDKF